MKLFLTVLVGVLASILAFTVQELDSKFFRWGFPLNQVSLAQLLSSQFAPTIPFLMRNLTRRLAYETEGVAYGFPVFYINDLGLSRFGAELWLDPPAEYTSSRLKRHNIRLIAFDRAGLGLSAPLSEHSIRNVVDDIIAMANFLDLDKFGVLGVGHGEVYALACAIMHPHRVASVVSVNGHVTSANSKLTLAGRIATYFPALTRTILRYSVYQLYGPHSYQYLDRLPLPELIKINNQTEELSQTMIWYLRDIVEGFRNGPQAATEELALEQLARSELDLSLIKSPVKLFVATEDPWINAEAALKVDNPNFTVVVRKDIGRIQAITLGGLQEEILAEFHNQATLQAIVYQIPSPALRKNAILAAAKDPKKKEKD